jgi:RNA polymerase sigma-70 factor (ECF subfamily)
MNAQINHIWEAHHNQLFNFIRKRVDDPDVAKDLLQDVFLKILDKIDTLKDSEKLQNWLYQITRNIISDYYRQKQKENKLAEYPFEAHEPEELNAMSQAESWIGLYVDELPENYRQAVELFELQGLSIAEIAQQLGISYTNARARIQRGRKALKKSLTDCCTFHVDVYGNVIDYYQNDQDCNCN